MELELILQSSGIIGIIIFYIVIAKLSTRMGEGLMLSNYYLLDYVACIIALSTIPIHLYLYQKPEIPYFQNSPFNLEIIYISLLLMSNVIVILVSLRYWWWLKNELWANNGGK